MILAPFQKQTQIEFTNIKLKEIAIRFLTVVNPLDKRGQVIRIIFLFKTFMYLFTIYTSINTLIDV